jgi:hypothetical protein
MSTSPADLLKPLAQAAKARFATQARWAEAAGVPKETLSRLKSQPSCDLRTLGALAKAVGYTLVPVPAAAQAGAHLPEKYGREYEDGLLDLCVSGNVEPAVWRSRGPAFFMAGLAVMLASARGFEREPYLRLAEALYPGASAPEVFAIWLEKSPVRASRFLPMARRRKGLS